MAVTSNDREDRKGEKLAQRLSQLLARLHQGEAIDKHQIALEFSVDVRTIERDIGERLHRLVERTPEGRWQLTASAKGTIPAKHLHAYAEITGTSAIYPDSSLQYLLTQIDKPKPQRSIKVQPVKSEHLENTKVFALLQQAVEDCNSCQFTYKNKTRNVNPYRLIHQNGIWYLTAEESARLKNFSVALITNFNVTTTVKFEPKIAHQSYIDTQEDIWFTPQITEVLLRVAPEAAHYFLRKQLLPHQTQYTDTDGSLFVTTKINHENQLLPIIQYWLPSVKIISPLHYNKFLIIKLKNAIDLLERSSQE